ncbi:MAG: carboxypeptidase regulatory-like domain-containing protein [Polyangiaceae bacterium]|nr:carboxypeptidase regulatory-like domain-containing protein [Polyangiaceae bacterium]
MSSRHDSRRGSIEGPGCADRGRHRSAVAWAKRATTVIAWATTVTLPHVAHAAEDRPATTLDPVGDTASALPGIARVGVPGQRTSVAAFAGTGSYGFTEAQADQSGTNHRAAGTLAVSVAPIDWLALGLRLDGRYDAHPADDRGRDSGGVGEPRLAARVGQAWRALRLGAEIAAWLPGSEAPSVDFAATTLDFRGLVGTTIGGGATTVGGIVGYRWDNSADSEPDPASLRVGDRAALGLSEFDALLLGIGLSQRVSSVEILGEVSADWLVGEGAPGLGHSPLRLTAGLRHSLSRRLAWEALGEVVPTARPSVAADAPMAPIEPRFSFYLGLRARLAPLPAPEAAPLVGPTETLAEGPTALPPEPAVLAPPPPGEPILCSVAGTVVDESGAPIVDAAVKATVGEKVLEERTDAGGQFELRGEACGKGELAVTAVDFDPGARDVELTEAPGTVVEILLRPAVPAGELRGLVRALDGRPIAARIRVIGTNLETTTGTDGSFSMQVAPGSYTVEVVAEGFARQRRAVRIDNRGVTILNADLRPGP